MTYTELLPPFARCFTFVNSVYSTHSNTDLALTALSCASRIKPSSCLFPLVHFAKSIWKCSLLQYWHQSVPVLRLLHLSQLPNCPSFRAGCFRCLGEAEKVEESVILWIKIIIKRVKFLPFVLYYFLGLTLCVINGRICMFQSFYPFWVRECISCV